MASRTPHGSFPGSNLNNSHWTDSDFEGWSRWWRLLVAIVDSNCEKPRPRGNRKIRTILGSLSASVRFRAPVKGCGGIYRLRCDILNVCRSISLSSSFMNRGHGKLLIFAHRTHCTVALLKPVTRETFCSLSSFLPPKWLPLSKLEIDTKD